MELSKPNRSDYPQFSNARLSLTNRSGRPMPDAEYHDLKLLMGQVCDRYPNQTLLPGTVDMFMADWEEMTLKHGLETFRDALLKALRESAFFPDPSVIRVHCEAIHLDKFDKAERKRKSEEYEAKRRHREEHPEEYVTNSKEAV